MFFSISGPYASKTTIFINACKYIYTYPMKANEVALNKYLIENYKVGLKQMCASLLYRTTLQKSANNSKVVVFLRKEDDEIARLITYGNEILQGSNILRHAIELN